MKTLEVAIIYRHHLYASGLESLLRQDRGVNVTLLKASDRTSLELLRDMNLDVVVIEGGEQDPAVSSAMASLLLRRDAGFLTVLLGISDAGMELRYAERLVLATPDDLRGAILAHFRRAPKRRKTGPDSDKPGGHGILATQGELMGR